MKDLIIEGVIHSYANTRILKTDYVKIESNCITGIVGRNGEGKSTLLKIIFGIIKADYSKIFFNNIELTKSTKIKTMSFLPQEELIPHFLKVKEFIKLSTINETNKEKLKIRFKDKINNSIRSLSGGEQRILEILYVIYLEKEITILDEPYRGLEPNQISEVNKIISKLEKIVIISSHLYDHLIEVTNDILLVKQGNIIKINKNDTLINHGYLPNLTNN